MTALERLLILAVLAQIVLTLAVGFWLGWTRKVAVAEKKVGPGVMLSPEGWPKQARAASNNFSNQFEVPVLFYALALLALWLKAVGPVLAVAAVVFVVSRVAHAIAHCGPNDLRFRAPAYFVGVVAVIVMLIDVIATVVRA